jgi:hypothetical protein
MKAASNLHLAVDLIAVVVMVEITHKIDRLII